MILILYNKVFVPKMKIFSSIRMFLVEGGRDDPNTT